VGRRKAQTQDLFPEKKIFGKAKHPKSLPQYLSLQFYYIIASKKV